uniref:Uncharacterized protein n=1 Tax=Amazona collaria TaxID=241587 RepID=A0A8B9FKV0_9PSIT
MAQALTISVPQEPSSQEGTQLPESPSKPPRDSAEGTPTYPGGCVLQVRCIHRSTQCHGARLSLLQVLLHFHQAQLQVHPPALLPFAFFIYLLQPLLQALICEGREGPGQYLLRGLHLLTTGLSFLRHKGWLSCALCCSLVSSPF